MPRQQIVDPVDLVVRDADQGVGQPFLRVDAVQPCGFDQGVGDGGGATAGQRADEEVVLPAEGDILKSALSPVFFSSLLAYR